MCCIPLCCRKAKKIHINMFTHTHPHTHIYAWNVGLGICNAYKTWPKLTFCGPAVAAFQRQLEWAAGGSCDLTCTRTHTHTYRRRAHTHTHADNVQGLCKQKNKLIHSQQRRQLRLLLARLPACHTVSLSFCKSFTRMTCPFTLSHPHPQYTSTSMGAITHTNAM